MFQSLTFRNGRSARGPALSATLHCVAIALLLIAGTNPAVQRSVESRFGHVSILEPYIPNAGHGGGGGGDRSPIPASKGRLPRLAPRQFTPPSPVIRNPEPRLPMEPTMIVAQNLSLPKIDLAVLGDPNGFKGPASSGPGSGSGIGTGVGTGIGPGKGPGLGPGEGGDVSGLGLSGASGETTAPVLIYRVEPEFSDEARKAKVQGVVMLSGEVDTNGRLRNIRITQGLGLGLNEKAIEAVRQWRFRPGYRDGHTVVTAATIEINFRLL